MKEVEKKSMYLQIVEFLLVPASRNKTFGLVLILAAMSNPSYGLNSGDLFVISGEEASIDDYPYMVAIFHKDVKIGTGVVIAEYWVLTAAHVVREPRRREDFVLVFGQTNVDRTAFPPSYNNGYGDFRIAVPEEIVIHPDFEHMSWEKASELARWDNDLAWEILNGHDIALLRLGDNDRVIDGTIPFFGERDNGRLEAGIEVVFGGWGMITREITTTITTILHVGTLPINRLLPALGLIGELGAGGINDPQPGKGDSGGPVVATFGGQHWLVGIIAAGTSGISDEIMSDYRTFFVRVDRHADWIERVTGIMAGRPQNQVNYHNIVPRGIVNFTFLLAGTGGAFGLGRMLRGGGIRLQNDPNIRIQNPRPQQNLNEDQQPLIQNQDQNIDDDEEKYDIYEEDRRARLQRAKNVKSSSSKKDC